MLHNRANNISAMAFMKLILAVILTFGLCIPISLLNHKDAYAAGSVYLDSPNTPIEYGGYRTTYMWADNAPVFCAQPSKATPSSGTYTKNTIQTTAAPGVAVHPVDDVYAALWFGWGGPGFDKSMWPSTWYDGSAMTSENYWALTHIIIADNHSADGGSALAGTNQAFRSWVQANILTWYDYQYSPNSVQQKMINRAGEVPQDFKNACYEISTGNSNDQTCVSFTPGGWIDLDKDSSNPALSNNNSCYDLAGAEYSVYSNSACTNKVTTLTTNSDGYAKSGYVSQGTYYVKETKAAKGYSLDSKTYTVNVSNGSTTRVNGSKVYDTPQNDPVGILLGKYDGQKTYVGEKNLPQGAASLAGAEFTVKYYDGQYSSVADAQKSGAPTRTWVYATNNNGFINIRNAASKVGGDDLYYDSNGTTTFPLGTYTFQETKAPEGYVINNEIYLRNITSDGYNSETINTFNTPQIPDQVKRGDLEFVKVVDGTNTRLANVPFKLTSETTGESHVLITDENGYVSTAAKWNKHSNLTNFNDSATEDTYNNEAGVWFGKTEQAGGTLGVNDSLGALPYDTYTLEELPCKTNEGYTLVKREGIVVKRDNNTVDLKMLYDMDPYITTSAKDALDGDKLIIADSEAQINDHVEYTGLEQGKTYTMRASLLDKDTDTLINGATAEKTFTVTHSHSGSVEVAIPVDLSEYGSHEVVVYEELIDANGKVIAEHKEKDSTEQTLTVLKPEIGTTATDAIDNDKVVVTDPESSIKDTISYRNLVPNKEYTAKGSVMVKNADGTEEPLLVNGAAVVATKTFTPKVKDGTVDVVFNFDSVNLEGKTLVIYEEVYKGDLLIAEHKEINDVAQTVTVVKPEIGTTATDKTDGDKYVVTDTISSVVDTVTYTNLVPGKEYVVSGKLMKKVADDKGNITEEPLVVNGEEVVASATFTPEEPNGEVEITFTFNSLELEGEELVAFEEVSRNDITVAIHADINDENQSVLVVAPKLATKATDALDNDKSVVADTDSSFVDTVSYSNLIVGKEYTFAGLIMNKNTHMPLLFGDTSDITDEEVVAFSDDLCVALGIEKITPKLDILGEANLDSDTKDAIDNFVDQITGGVTAPVEGNQDVIEIDTTKTIDYEKIAEVLQKHSKVVAHLALTTQKVVPEKTNGTISMNFENLDTKELAGKDTVVFEVALNDNRVCASHTDFTDKDQSVAIVSSNIKTEATDKTDGDHKLLRSADSTIVDTVSYKNLLPGKEYVLKGKVMNKTTGDVLLSHDKEVVATAKFTPNTPDGTTELEFAFDSTALKDGQELVVFEELYKDDILVATHADIDDEAQTVVITEVPNAYELDKTGSQILPWIIGIGVLVIAIAGFIAYGIRQRKIAAAENAAADSNNINNELF